MCSAFNPSKCTHTHTWSSGHTHTHTHTWSSGQPTLRRPGSSWRFGALLKGLTSVVDTSCRSRDSNPQPRVTSPTLYPLGHDCPHQRRLHPFHFICKLRARIETFILKLRCATNRIEIGWYIILCWHRFINDLRYKSSEIMQFSRGDR